MSIIEPFVLTWLYEHTNSHAAYHFYIIILEETLTDLGLLLTVKVVVLLMLKMNTITNIVGTPPAC